MNSWEDSRCVQNMTQNQQREDKFTTETQVNQMNMNLENRVNLEIETFLQMKTSVRQSKWLFVMLLISTYLRMHTTK